jgi:hypothetical protein
MKIYEQTSSRWNLQVPVFSVEEKIEKTQKRKKPTDFFTFSPRKPSTPPRPQGAHPARAPTTITPLRRAHGAAR